MYASVAGVVRLSQNRQSWISSSAFVSQLSVSHQKHPKTKVRPRWWLQSHACSYLAQVSSSAAVFACDPSCRCCTQSRLPRIGNRSGSLLIYNVQCFGFVNLSLPLSLSFIFRRVMSSISLHLYNICVYIVGLTLFHLFEATFLNQSPATGCQ